MNSIIYRYINNYRLVFSKFYHTLNLVCNIITYTRLSRTNIPLFSYLLTISDYDRLRYKLR